MLALYRAALDVSFRKSGGLFVILKNREKLREIVKRGDAIGDTGRDNVDVQFDETIGAPAKIQNLRRPVLVDIASLDGAVVIDNSGTVRAYAAILDPKNKGRVSRKEGSRTRAAVGASNYGVSLKISSDGDITAYAKQEEFLRI